MKKLIYLNNFSKVLNFRKVSINYFLKQSTLSKEQTIFKV
jgi:hypothetical protein